MWWLWGRRRRWWRRRQGGGGLPGAALNAVAVGSGPLNGSHLSSSSVQATGRASADILLGTPLDVLQQVRGADEAEEGRGEAREAPGTAGPMVP